MYKNNTILALIPARGGSKGIKNKNIVNLQGKPLLYYTINAAQRAACFDDIVVSTDSDTIAAIAVQLGANVPFLRPRYLAGDEAKSEPVAMHALEELKKRGKTYDIIVYLQPTSPLRTENDILNALDIFIDNKLPNLASISPVNEHPLFMRTIDNDGYMKKVINKKSNVRRQDLHLYYIINGAIYINRTKEVISGWCANENMYGYIMSGINGLDINNYDDLLKAERLLYERQ